MYLIDRKANRCIKVEQKKFSDLGFRERDHLQEWLAAEPSMFGERLLIIQKEFDGFSDTRERLDLLALDENGNVVVIENKLDDTGRDVVWQSLKYASYCSSLGKEELRSIYQDYLKKSGSDDTAEQRLSAFLKKDYDEIILNKGASQRIFLVAAMFRKEVTSTVLWLMNYNLKIQCFKVTPYQNGEELFLDIEQIIPIKDAEEFMIRTIEKNQDDSITETQIASRHIIRERFWNELLKAMNSKTDLFKSISANKDNWIGIGAGISGVAYNFVITKGGSRVEMYIGTPNKERNKEIFEFLLSRKEEIEKTLSSEIIWSRYEDKEASKLHIDIDGNYFEEDQWPTLIEKMINRMIEFHKATQGHLKEYRSHSKI